ncbi:MAG TPA: hypothetical protein VFO95_02790 [Gemmatimonadales bacterium]|nr:hypothetical protein [Gemmatimonadales bacterium]
MTAGRSPLYWILPLAFAVMGPISCHSADGPVVLDQPADLKATAAALYDSYTTALTEGRPEALSGYYHPDGAIRVINGSTRRATRAGLDSSYRSGWNPPAFFAWDSLTFDSIAPGKVIVTGTFRWVEQGKRDTTHWLYAALLQAAQSGLAIRFEHETLKPSAVSR